MTKIVEKHTLSSVAFIIALVLIVVAFNLAEPHSAISDTTTTPSINGFGWSDTTGWISFNCATGGPSSNPNICATAPYGMMIDGSGNITGDAWSDNIGWITANPAGSSAGNDLTGCPPPGPCTATIDSSGNMHGWMRALAGTGTQTGGWDGWISLSGANYGIQESLTGATIGQFANCPSCYAWGGGTDVGWIDFSYASTTYNTCTAGTSYECTGASGNIITTVTTSVSCAQVLTPGTACSVSPGYPNCVNGSSTCLYPAPSATFTVSPRLVPSGTKTQVSWTVTNAVSCTVTGSNGDGPWSGLSGNQTSSVIVGQVTYTLSCVQDDPTQQAYTQSITVNSIPSYEEQ